MRIFYSALLFLFIFQSCATYQLATDTCADISNKVWVVTGASSGLGRGIALEAGKCHAKVVLASRNEKALNTVAELIRQSGGMAWVLPVDVSDSSAMMRLAQEVVMKWGHIDVWINNAGVTVLGNFWEVPLREHSRVIDVNLKGTLFGSYVALQQFYRQEYGTLINIASAESRIPTAYQTAYAASKAAVKNLGIVIRQELRLEGKKNIRIITLDPWALNTPIWDHAANHTGHAPRMSMMDRTPKAIHAVMRAAIRHSNRDIAVGWKTRTAYVIHWIAPRISNRLASNIVYRHQIKMSPEQKDTVGNLFKPSSAPMHVETDIRKRMKDEKKAYRHNKKQQQ